MNSNFYKRILFFSSGILFAVVFLCGSHIMAAEKEMQAPEILQITDNSKTSVELYPYLEVFKDPTRNVSFEDITNGKYDSEFKSGFTQVPAYGFTDSDYWVRFKVKNESLKNRVFILEFDEALVDYVTFYVARGPDTYKVFKGGDFLRATTREISDDKYIARMRVSAQETQTAYVHISGGYAVIPLKLYTENAHKNHSDIKNMILGISYGIIIALALYNLIIFVGSRDPVFLNYSFYHMVALAFYMTFNGTAMRFVTYNMPVLSNYLVSVLSFLMVTALSAFIRRYLNLKENQPRFDKILVFMIYFSLVMAGVSFLLPINTAAQLGSIGGAVGAIIVLITIIRGVIKKTRSTGMLLLAMGGYLLGVVIYVARGNGLLPDNTFTNYAMQMGSSLEAILMAVGISYRMNQLRKEKERATKDALAAEQRLTNELEEQVAQRTSELHEKNQALEEANQTKNKFFSILAHDLRGPLGNLSYLFNEMVSDPSEIPQELFEHYRRSTGSTYELLEDLLTWSKSQKGELELKHEAVSIDELLEKVKQVARITADAKGISVIIEKDREKMFIFADEASITTVLRNLVSNSVKFTPRGGAITLQAKIVSEPVETLPHEDNQSSEIDAGKSLRLCVQDTGIGIPADKLDKIFKISERRVSSPGTDNEKGSGLGLVLVNEFVVAHGSSLNASSIVGEGTTFCFNMPLFKKVIRQDKPEEASEPQFNLPAGYKKMSVLVAEDNPLNLETSMHMLKTESFDAVSAKDGVEVLEKLETNTNFDVVFMDIDMPRMNGITCVKKIREQNLPLKVIALTSYDKKEIDEMGATELFDGYLKKPLSKNELYRELNEAFKTEPSTQEMNTSAGARALVIDDDPDQKMLMSLLLKKLNMTMTYAADKIQALEVASGQESFDIVFLDYELGKNNAEEMLPLIKAKLDTKPTGTMTRYICMSAHQDDSFKKRMFHLGFNAVITKPVTRQQLKEVI